MKNRKEEDKKKYLLLLVLLLGIGFAAISTTLFINGSVNIGNDADAIDFRSKVTFNSVSVDSVSGTKGSTASLSEDKKTITFTTHDLTTVGETVVLTYDVINNSKFAANLDNLSCTCEEDDWDTYLDVTPANTLSGTTLAKNTVSSTDTLTIELKHGLEATGTSGNKTYTFSCTLPATAVES